MMEMSNRNALGEDRRLKRKYVPCRPEVLPPPLCQAPRG